MCWWGWPTRRTRSTSTNPSWDGSTRPSRPQSVTPSNEYSTSYVNQQQINYAYSQKVGVSPYIYALSPASIPIASTNLPATPNSGSNLVLAKVHSTLSSSQRYNPVGGGGAAHTYGLTPVLVGLSASFSGSIPAKIAEVRCS